MTIEAIERPEAAQSVSTPADASAAQRKTYATDDLMAAIGSALAASDPTIAAHIEANLGEALSQARARREHERAAGLSRTLEWFRDLRGAASLAPTAASDPDQGAATPDEVLWRVTLASVMSVLSPKKAERVLESIRGRLDNELSLGSVTPIRAKLQAWRAYNDARQQATARFLRSVPFLISSLPRAR